jgi:2-polyprenyl-3-methyl-5-hydroxy-6-metoxy-1,4-benzoquinol methylase
MSHILAQAVQGRLPSTGMAAKLNVGGTLRMARIWNETNFEECFNSQIAGGTFNEAADYYPRYKSRYRDLLIRYAAIAPLEPQDVLDIGGGQFALLCKALWNDRSHAADIGGPHLDYLRLKGVETTQWNLCDKPSPFADRFDFVFFSEVIEHLPIPGHIVLGEIRKSLKPGGVLICSTPNLYRLRNIVYMALGKQIFDHFRFPVDQGLGHVLEYSADHLSWQLDRAGFPDAAILFVQMHHQPNEALFRALYRLGSPLFLVPRFRDNLVVIVRRTARSEKD